MRGCENPMYIALDVGGTNGRAVAYESHNDTLPLGPEEVFTMSDHSDGKPGDFQQDYDRLHRACICLHQQFGRGSGPLEGVGLALAGKLDGGRERLIFAGNIAHWVNQPVKVWLERDLGCRVVLGNDAEAAALAEAVYGVANHEFPDTDFLGMIWGTGIGGACVRYASGQMLAIPGEPGHITIGNDTDIMCRGCEDYGHLEAYCGGANLPSHFGKPAERLSESEWLHVADWMTAGLKSILSVQPVSLVTFSGGIACKQSWLLPKLEERLARPRYGSPKIRLSQFGESAGTLGALSLLWL